jgi:hypothetical protein
VLDTLATSARPNVQLARANYGASDMFVSKPSSITDKERNSPDGSRLWSIDYRLYQIECVLWFIAVALVLILIAVAYHAYH